MRRNKAKTPKAKTDEKRAKGKAVRDLPANHDPSDMIAAMTQAMDVTTPALGVLYREERPTLNDAMDEIVRAAGGKPGTERAAVA